MVLLGNVEQVSVLDADNKTVALSGSAGRFTAAGVEVTVQGGSLSITTHGVSLNKVLFSWSYTLKKEAKILSDTWGRNYAELGWVPADDPSCGNMPWYFLAADGETVSCFGVKTQPNTFCLWGYNAGKISLSCDLRSGAAPLDLNGRVLHMCDVVDAQYTCDAHTALRQFCRQMCDNPRMPKLPVYGGNDWYCNYGHTSHEKIVTHAKRIVACAPNCQNKPYMVLDDGWQLCHDSLFNGGPWRYSNYLFGDMGQLAADVKAAGAIPGIWFRPLQTAEKLPNVCSIKDADGDKHLDPTVPGVLDYVTETIEVIKNWGFRLIKHDFSTFDIFGANNCWWRFKKGSDLSCEPTSLFHDRTRTTAEIIKSFYQTVRDAAGEDVLVIGCNTISHLSAGLFDLQRTGDDTSGLQWKRAKEMGVNTMAFRSAQHGAFYGADADCVGITDQIPWKNNSQLLDMFAKSGTPLFVSIAENCFSDTVAQAVTDAFAYAAQPHDISVPLDWMETMFPTKWRSDDGAITTYNWDV